MKKRALVVCPGRGTYTKETLGYLKQHARSDIRAFIADVDQRRAAVGDPTVSDLDRAPAFDIAMHTRGEHASALIYTCALADLMSVNREQFDIVAVTGNSMGWYLACAAAGVLDPAGAFFVVNVMGSMMREEIIGGQVIYPICNEQWQVLPELVERARAAVQRAGPEVYLSIDLGGYLVWGATPTGVRTLLKELPPVENFPMQLMNHAAFHTPLLRSVAERAFSVIHEDLFRAPVYPLIDGRGAIWQPHSTTPEDIYHYTLGHQVVEPYDFRQAITVGLKEFAPDVVILLGPGSSLGASIGQVMIQHRWLGLTNKSDFMARQAESPFVLAMGRPDQRQLVV